MIIALIIVSAIMLLSLAFNFILIKVLKSTFDIIIKSENLFSFEIDHDKAYDGKYYPCKLLLMSIDFGHPHTEMIADFSMYDDKKIIGLNIKTKSPLESFIKSNPELVQYHRERFGDENSCNVMIPSAIVYSPIEGAGAWKPQQKEDNYG